MCVTRMAGGKTHLTTLALYVCITLADCLPEGKRLCLLYIQLKLLFWYINSKIIALNSDGLLS